MDAPLINRRTFLASAAAALATSRLDMTSKALGTLMQPAPGPVPILPRAVLHSSLLVCDPSARFPSGRLEILATDHLRQLDFEQFFAADQQRTFGDLDARAAQRNREGFEDRLRFNNLNYNASTDIADGRWLLTLEEHATTMGHMHSTFDMMCRFADPEGAALEAITQRGLAPITEQKLRREWDGWPMEGGVEKREALKEQFARERAYFEDLCDATLSPRHAHAVKEKLQDSYDRCFATKEHYAQAIGSQQRTMLLRDLIHDAGEGESRMAIECEGKETSIDLTFQPTQHGYKSGWDKHDLSRIQHRIDDLYNMGLMHEKPTVETEHLNGIASWPITKIHIHSEDPWMRQFARELLQEYAAQEAQQQVTMLQRFTPDSLAVEPGAITDGQQQFTLRTTKPRGAVQILRFTEAAQRLNLAADMLAKLQRPPADADAEPQPDIPLAEWTDVPDTKDDDDVPGDSPKMLSYQPLNFTLPQDSPLATELNRVAGLATHSPPL